MRFLQAAEGIINSNQKFVSSIEAVIYCYRIIAEFNTMVGANKATQLGAFQMHARLSRHCYLALLRCAQAATTRPETSARQDSDVEDNTSVARMLDADDDDDDDDDDLGQAAPEPPGRTIKTKIEKLMTLPNVHVGLHLAANIWNYGTVMNCNVLAGELKHKFFKGLADDAAPPNLMAYLFTKDVVRQSIRLGLAGAWAYDYPELNEPLSLLYEKCPRLLNSFVPISEHNKTEVNDEDALDVLEVIEDDAHKQVRLSNKGFCLTVPGSNPFGLRATLRLSNLHATHSFTQQVRQALYLEYSVANAVTLSKHLLKWYQRLAYTDPTNNRRRVHNVGDYIVVRQTTGRLIQCFTMRFRDRPRPYVFVIVQPVHQLFDNDDKEICDDALGLPAFKMDRQQQLVCGLPGLSGEVKYFVQAPVEGPWMDEEDEDKSEFVLECDWNIDSM